MRRAIGALLQIVAFVAFAAVVGYLSASPEHEYGSAEHATVKLSLSHAANRVEPCVKLTPQEIAELAPNMRRAESCERERLPLTVELDIDGDAVILIEAAPSGLWGDGPASVYERFDVNPGLHTITAKMRDSARGEGWDYIHSEQVDLEAGRYFVVTFRSTTGEFQFR